MPGLIYFDISDVLIFARNNNRVSGIQRVVLSMLKQISALQPDHTVRLIAYHPGFHQVMTIKTDFFDRESEYSSSALRDHFFLEIWQPHPDVSNRTQFFRHALAYHKLRWALRLGLSSRFDASDNRREHGSLAILSRPQLNSNDIIFLPGAFWGIPPFRRFLEAQHRRGVKIYTFIHDLIPVVAPQMVDRSITETYTRDLQKFATFTSRFFANSDSTKLDLENFISATQPSDDGENPEKINQIPTITKIPLAHEFPVSSLSGYSQVASHEAKAKPQNFVLSVGTIEIRKNHWSLVETWIRLHKKLGEKTPRLVLAGRYGWKIQELRDLLSATGNVSGLVSIVDDASDLVINGLYETCLFTVYPSFYEGWGLPVGESLWHGKTCVASSTSSMPEVGGDLCVYANPHDLEDMYKKILGLIQNPQQRLRLERKIKKAKLRSWADVAADLQRELRSDNV